MQHKTTIFTVIMWSMYQTKVPTSKSIKTCKCVSL